MHFVPSKTAMYFVCQGCQAFYEQPLGRTVEKVQERSGNVNIVFKTQAGPPVPQKCTECGSALHVSRTNQLGSRVTSQVRGRLLVQCGLVHYTIMASSQKCSSTWGVTKTDMVQRSA